ncbi:MAG: hypothetical protein DRO14_04830 [Thermoprotei archaeon]|nr:MAG: hypothetical protein DRO14_04830 [Thermoprotei archaeon]
MGKAEKLKKIRYMGLVLMLVGTIIGLFVFTTAPLSPAFMAYFTAGTAIFIVGSLLFMAYEVFVPEFWRGEWAPGPGHEYPPDGE